MLDHFLSKSDQGKLRCRAAGSVSSQPHQLMGENGTKKCYDPLMVTSKVRFKRIGLVIDNCQVSRLLWSTGLISGIVSAPFFATPATTPSFSVSSRTADCVPTGVEMRMFQVPVRDMC